MRQVLDMVNEEEQNKNNDEEKDILRPDLDPEAGLDEALERTPGVYTRADGKSPQEIDLLWSEAKTYHKEERSPVLFFVAGFLLSALIIGAVLMLFTQEPQIETGEQIQQLDTSIEEAKIIPGLPDTVAGPSEISEPTGVVSEDTETSETVDTPEPTVEKTEKPTKAVDVTPISTAKTVEKPEAKKNVTEAQMTTYVVKSGDTLEKIAKKHYGSMDPKYIDKIQRASSMKNPNRLSIGQKLVIPPKDY